MRTRSTEGTPGGGHWRKAARHGVRLGALLLAGTSCASAGAWATHPTSKLTAADRTFIQAASRANRFEIATGDVAAQVLRTARTQPSKAVATIGRMLASDHQTSQRSLTRLAKSTGARIPDQPDPVQQFLVTQLAAKAVAVTGRAGGSSNATGAGMGPGGGKKGSNGHAAPSPSSATARSTAAGDFRSFFLAMQAAAHQQAIQLYSSAATTTRNDAVRSYACRALPVLRSHLTTVQHALGSAQPALAMSGSTALAQSVAKACSGVPSSG